MNKKSSAGNISPTQDAFTSSFPSIAHSNSLASIPCSIKILLSYLAATSIAFLIPLYYLLYLYQQMNPN